MSNLFRWNDWNRGHIAEHSVSEAEAEYVVDHARPPYPRHGRDGSWFAWGQTWRGRYLQVAYVEDPDGETLYVIHARDLTDGEKHRLRRQRR